MNFLIRLKKLRRKIKNSCATFIGGNCQVDK